MPLKGMGQNLQQDIRDKILLQALPDIVFDGWEEDVIAKAALDAGYDEDTLAQVFPNRVIDALDGFADYADREMLLLLGQENLDDMRIRDRIRIGVMARFEVLMPYKEAVRAGLSYLSCPLYHVRGGQFVWRTADHIWEWAGDKSTDYNRYTKRGLLSGVIGATMMHWFDDTSEDMVSTKAFLDRRIENVMQLNKFLGKFKNEGV